jgi:ubiquinone/menaquinone biosynthesis C-methylase UbiE
MENKIMNEEKKHRVCPVEKAGILDFGFRKLLQNPIRILRPYIKEGMTVLDLGCGPGFFTLEMARLVGSSGKVIAADLQEGMLGKVKAKVKKSALAGRVKFHQCFHDKIGLAEKCDFILVFYMFHEVPDRVSFLREITALLNPAGEVLLAEPQWHVTRDEFLEAIAVMEQAGFAVREQPKIRFSRTVLLRRADAMNSKSRL